MESSANKYSDAWLSAINRATFCLRSRGNVNICSVDVCLQYLSHLVQQLERLQDDSGADDLSLSPSFFPPDWVKFVHSYERRSGTMVTTSIDNTVLRGGKPLDCRRILIRILTSQSECFALKAKILSNSNEWKVGAMQYQFSLEKIHLALDIADSQICKWIHASTEMDYAFQSSKEDLEEDADIVAVSIESLTKERDRFVHLSKREEAKLIRELEPHWESRDRVKQSWGEERWKNNPNPKFAYAKLRREFEMRYHDIKNALMVLENMDMYLNEMKEKSATLKNQIDNDSNRSEAGSRYNQIRPGAEAMKRRVPIRDYPDPTDFGWTFTGSSNFVEFFEKDGVKLDWFFTSATLKTSLDHPFQGKTQMFRKNVNPEQFREILMNPRAHTDKGYQRKKNRKPTN